MSICFRHALHEISVPTLLINAVDDPLANHEYAKKASEQIPNAEFVSISRGSHVMLGSGNIVRSEIESFLSGVVYTEREN